MELEMRVKSGCERFRSLQARIPSETVAELLGFEKHDITVLVSNKLLKPLGKPAPNVPKRFASKGKGNPLFYSREFKYK